MEDKNRLQKSEGPGCSQGLAEKNKKGLRTPFLANQARAVNQNPDLTRTPPAAPEAEQSVLAGILSHPERILDVDLTARSFYSREHQTVFAAMHRLKQKGTPIDMMTLADELSRSGELDLIGGRPYLADLASGFTGNFGEAVRIVREMETRRRLVDTALALYDGAHDEARDLAEVVALARSLDRLVTRDKRLIVADAGQLLSLALPPREYLLSPVIPRQGLVMLYAPRGIGKTYAAMSIAYAVASGQRVFGWEATKPRRVLYLDGEMPASAMQERLAALVAGYAGTPPGPEYLRFLTPDLQPAGLPMPNLATREGQAAIAPFLDGVELVVVDNLATLARAGRENDAEGWLPVQEWLLALRQQGLSVLVVHHAGKSGQQRGTSSREDVLDTVISLRRPQDYRQEEGARFEVHLEKARGICGDEAKSFEATLETQGDALVWRCRDLEDVRLAQVRALVADGLSVREIAEESGIPKSTVQRLKRRLEVN